MVVAVFIAVMIVLPPMPLPRRATPPWRTGCGLSIYLPDNRHVDKPICRQINMSSAREGDDADRGISYPKARIGEAHHPISLANAVRGANSLCFRAGNAHGPFDRFQQFSRHPSGKSGGILQGDLFLLDSPLHGEIRGKRSLIAFPFFALSKNAWMKPLTYDHATVSIEVRPSASGVATINDKEIVLYIASLMAAKLEAGENVEHDFVFTAHDLFSVTGSNHLARSYGRLSEALERLQGAQINTNIEAGGEGASSRGCRKQNYTIPRPRAASGS
jgi:hypothetical protein